MGLFIYLFSEIHTDKLYNCDLYTIHTILI